MKKILLLVVILSLLSLQVWADSIKSVKIVDDNNDTCLDETNNRVNTSTYLTDGTNEVDINANGSLEVTIQDSEAHQLNVDVSTSGIITEPYLQKKVMEGKVIRYGVQDLALADDATIAGLLTISSTGVSYIFARASAGGDAELFLYENPTVLTTGTSSTGQRVNRQIPKTFGTTYSYAPICSSYGTKICDVVISGGTGRTAAGGEGSGDLLIPVISGEQYLYVLENEAGSAKVAGLCIMVIED